jgi:hypothetical protein
MLRVVLGRTRPDIELSEKFSGLQFNSAPGAQESRRSRGETSTVLTVTRSHLREEVDLEVNEQLRTEPLQAEQRMDGEKS